MMTIRFRFRPEKMVATLTFLAQRVSDLDAMKTVKLLFFADRTHLRKYGRPILGDTYYGMDHGPVPSATFDVIKEAFYQTGRDVSTDTMNLLAEYLDVDRGGDRPRFVARQAPDMDWLSASDIEALEETLQQLGTRNALDLRTLAHEQPEVQYADNLRRTSRRGSVPIPFKLLLDQEDSESLEAVEDAQEERDFAESLLW
jgi:uncharacterized phage-associated protein